ncbi:AAA domain-containing protein [Labrys portucalensis]|uniref:AAA domain-containing protein n=1 Tax=Labrys neptuniae TaxID=376174 RepID=A0ABV6ZS92_9HYPH
MASRRGSKKAGFLSNFTEEGSYLIRPDRKSGRPGIFRARDSDGREVLAKFWPSDDPNSDVDLLEIWRSEIRQLQRLAALPKGEELLISMASSGRDADGFYLILDPGRGSPLETFFATKNRHPVLNQPRSPRNRVRNWLNARRLVSALELLHSQGTVHRNIDGWSVVTALSEEPDFKLTGFEWSVRISSMSGSAPSKLKNPPDNSGYASFARDWQKLGLLFTRLFGLTEARVLDLTFAPSDVAENFSSGEASLLRLMLGLQSSERIDPDHLRRRIDEIVSMISSEAAEKEAKYCLAIRLGRGSPIAETIRSISSDIEADDHEEQLRFVINDLEEEPYFALVQPEDHPIKYMLLGRELVYRLEPFRAAGSTDEATWEFAWCERAERNRPPGGYIKGSIRVDPAALDVQASIDASKVFARRRGRVSPWNDLIRKTTPVVATRTSRDQAHQALALLLVLEMAYAVADVFAVEVLPPRPVYAGDGYLLAVRIRSDKSRSKLSEILGLRPPAIRLKELIDAEGQREAGPWSLSDSGTLGERVNDTEWRFDRITAENGQETFWFEGSAPQQVSGAAFLTPSGMTGRTSQFKRRMKALKVLRDHSELLGMVVDRRLRLQESQDHLDDADDQFQEMDQSKQHALREILATVPIFLLQGPPGVGKTYLVGDLVRRRFEDDPTTRMLLSAQSNSAIDHLMDEVRGVFSKSKDPLMIRARSADDDSQDDGLGLDEQADRLLASLASSPLAASAPVALKARLEGLVSSDPKVGAPKQRNNAELRAFHSMILRAANLVFATTNSSAVERLIDEGSLFDWSIVEEAGKATGGELVSPLLLSNRRLMIGDHKQLPPYGVDKIIPLLSKTKDVQEALKLCEESISRHLKDEAIDDLFEEVGADTDFGALCGDALRLLTMFETFVEQEFDRQKRSKRGMPIARRLTEQRRMHPAIAKIVSDCFYGGELTTNPKKGALYRSKTPIVGKWSASVQFRPITFIDLPYVRKEPQCGCEDRRPPWNNPKEVEAVISALSKLEVVGDVNGLGKPPRLAILSPYREQVKLIRDKITQSGSLLGNLKQFETPFSDGSYCGTVDSFQGDEADVVVVSLVRNNHHSTPSKALGFLQDVRRMNVLLSRAKWMMVVVGSLDFYRSIVEYSRSQPDKNVEFLRKFLDALEQAKHTGDAAIIDFGKKRGGNA